MKRRRILAMITGAISLALSAQASDITLQSLEHEWISSKYVEALRKTGSPLAATEIAEPLVFRVHGFRLDITNFHEATWRTIVGLDRRQSGWILRAGALENPPDSPGEITPIPFSFSGEGAGMTVTAPLWSHDAVRYERIDGGAQSLVNELTIAGRYRDSKGTPVEFEKSGKATWGERRFTFQVAIDMSEACCDYYFEGNPDDGKRIGFKRAGRKLQLFHAMENPDECPITCEKKPFAILTPAN